MSLVLTANEARILDDLLFRLLLGSEVSERVDDDAKDQIQDNNYHDKEEEHIIDDSGWEERFDVRRRPQDVSDTAAISQPLIQRRDDAHPQGVARPFLQIPTCRCVDDGIMNSRFAGYEVRISPSWSGHPPLAQAAPLLKMSRVN